MKHRALSRSACPRKRRYAAALAVILMALNSQAAVAGRTVDWEKKLQKGYYELSIGNVDKAVGIFRGKVKSNPTSGACHTALGLALKKKGKVSEAKAEFRRATEVDPDYAEAYYELGAIQEGDKEYASALKSFERYLVLHPDSNRKGTVAERIRFCKEKL